MWKFSVWKHVFTFIFSMHFNYTAIDAIDNLCQVLFVKQIVSLWDIPSIKV